MCEDEDTGRVDYEPDDIDNYDYGIDDFDMDKIIDSWKREGEC
jgi:hypothetical protein